MPAPLFPLAQITGDVDFTNIVGVLLCIGTVIALIGILVAFFLRAGAKVGGSESDAEQRFEREVLRELPGLGVPAVSPGLPPGPAPEPAALPVAMGAAAAPPLAGAPATAPPVDLADFVSRLKILGLLGAQEGKLPMPYPPDLPIHRLARGSRIALISPRVESEAFLTHNCRRFDLVICMTGSGEPLIVSRLQERLPELLDRP